MSFSTPTLSSKVKYTAYVSRTFENALQSQEPELGSLSSWRAFSSTTTECCKGTCLDTVRHLHSTIWPKSRYLKRLRFMNQIILDARFVRTSESVWTQKQDGCLPYGEHAVWAVSPCILCYFPLCNSLHRRPFTSLSFSMVSLGIQISCQNHSCIQAKHSLYRFKAIAPTVLFHTFLTSLSFKGRKRLYLDHGQNFCDLIARNGHPH